MAEAIADRQVATMRAWGQRHGLTGDDYERRVAEVARLLDEAVDFALITGENCVLVSDPLIAELLTELQAVA